MGCSSGPAAGIQNSCWPPCTRDFKLKTVVTEAEKQILKVSKPIHVDFQPKNAWTGKMFAFVSLTVYSQCWCLVGFTLVIQGTQNYSQPLYTTLLYSTESLSFYLLVQLAVLLHRFPAWETLSLTQRGVKICTTAHFILDTAHFKALLSSMHYCKAHLHWVRLLSLRTFVKVV